MRLVVTGASGLLGRTVIEKLARSGHDIVVLGRDIEKLRRYFTEPILGIQSNYELSHLTEIFKGRQAVIHLAGRRVAPGTEGFRPFYEANIHITENVMEAAGRAGVHCVCQASSLSVYSSSNSIPCMETEPPIPVSLYGISKLACEHIGTLTQRKYPLRVISLRIAGVLGYGDITGENFMLSRFIQLARKKQTLQIFGEGVGARDLIYVEDVANAFTTLLALDPPSDIYNIGASRPYSVRELAESINRVFDNNGNISFDIAKPEDKRFMYMDCSRAERELNWKPAWTLSMALQEMRKAYDAE